MIKAEIQVGPQQYVIEFPEAKSLEEAYNEALAIAMGNKISKGPKGWLDLNKKDYDHIRVYEENPVASLPFGMVQPPDIKPAAPENPALINNRMEVYGQKIDLEVTEYFDDDLKFFLMPYKINGQPALTMLRREALREITAEYARKVGHIEYEVVLPHGPIIDDQEALAFVKDYAEETEAERERLLTDTDKTARGFSWPTEKE